MARYHFVVVKGQQRHADEAGTHFRDDEGARAYAARVIRELKESGDYDDPEWVMVVEDDAGNELFRIYFTSIN